MKILHTGDLHIGREYKTAEPSVAALYRQARLDALNNIIRIAETENCNYIVIAGDFFDSHNPPASLINTVCEMLNQCPCPVLILPGNHDYCQDEDTLWAKVKATVDDTKIKVLDQCKAYDMGDTVFYACPCNDRYSDNNQLAWLKVNRNRDSQKFNVGIAHGAIEGLSYDSAGKYYFMEMLELEGLGMDFWLVGHTHIPFPSGEIIKGQHIFNAGTHQQTDIVDNSEGSVFVIDITDDKAVTARKIHTGTISFVRKELNLAHGKSLQESLMGIVNSLDDPKHTTLRLTISGIAPAEEYATRENIYNNINKELLFFDPIDFDLQPEITADMIDMETIADTPENALLKGYLDSPELLSLAMDLVRSCKNGGDKDEDR